MEKFEQEIRKQLSESRTMQGLDEDVLWNAISAPPSENFSSPGIKRYFLWWLLLAMLSIGAAVVVFQGSEKPLAEFVEEEPNSDDAAGADSEQESFQSISLHDSLMGKTGVFEDTTERLVRIPTVTDLGENREVISVRRGMDSKGKMLRNQTNQIEDISNRKLLISSSREMDRLTHRVSESRTKVNKGEIDFGNTITLQSRNGDENILVSSAPDIQKLFLLPAPHFEFSPKPMKLSVMANGKVDSSLKEAPFTWTCYAGGLFLMSRYTSGDQGLVDSLNLDLSPEIGYTAGGAIRIKYGKYWQLNAGLEFMKWMDRFDKVFLSDTILLINQTEVLTQKIRTIEHHNKADILVVPLEIGVHKNFGCLHLGMNVGASYSFVLSQSGRLLNGGSTVVDYSQSNKRYDNFFSLRLTPSVGYMLSEKLMFNMYCPISMQKHRSSALNGLEGRSFYFAPSIGLMYNY
jgi:hypothetical protein